MDHVALWCVASAVVGFIAGALVVHNTKNGVSAKIDELETKIDAKLEEVKNKNKTGF